MADNSQTTANWSVCESCEHPGVCRQEDECLIDHHSLYRMELHRQREIAMKVIERDAPLFRRLAKR